MSILRCRVFIILGLALWGEGCARYQAKPLSATAVDAALAVPDQPALRVAAAQLRHPVLRPVELDPAKGYTPDEVAVIAVVANPDLRVERDRRAAAGAQLLQAGILPNPVLSAGVDVPYNSSPPDNQTAYSVGVAWDVTSLIGRDARRRAASLSAASVDLDVAWREWQTAEAAKLAAYNVLADQAQLAPVRDAEAHLSRNLDAVRRAVKQHQRTLADVPAAEAAARDAHTAVLTLDTDLRRQRMALNRTVGLPPDAVLPLRAPDVAPTRLLPPEDLLAGLEQARVDLLALKTGYESQEATLRAAILGQFPRINLGLTNARDTSNVHTVGIGVGVDLPIFDRNQGTIAAEQATRQRLFDEYTSRLFAARADLAAAAEEIRITSELAADTEAAVPALERLVATYEAALRRGNADVLSYYNALAALDLKRIAAIKLRQQTFQNWVALELASGRCLPLSGAGGATATTSPTTKESRQ